jgi:hypothetical protein
MYYINNIYFKQEILVAEVASVVRNKSYGFYVFHVRALKTDTQLRDKPTNAHL